MRPHSRAPASFDVLSRHVQGQGKDRKPGCEYRNVPSAWLCDYNGNEAIADLSRTDRRCRGGRRLEWGMAAPKWASSAWDCGFWITIAATALDGPNIDRK